MTILRNLIVLVFALGLSACAIPVYMGGHTDDYAEVISGSAIVDIAAGTSIMEMTAEGLGVTCSGSSALYEDRGGIGSRSKGLLNCSDGRTLHAEMLQTTLTGGIGTGSDDYGNTATFTWDMGQTMINRLLDKVRKQVKASGRTLADLKGPADGKTGFAHTPPGMSVRSKPPPVVTARPTPTAPQVTKATPPKKTAKFNTVPIEVSFKSSRPNPDDVAVIIGNADYGKQGKDIPDVIPAYADAEGFKRYAMEALGLREGNIIHLPDATSAQMVRVFGSERNHQGQLYDWVKPNKSRVWVYYAGHGAPSGKSGTAFLVPSDADGTRIDLNGYSLSTLYANLSKLPSPSVTVVLEACFSGAAQGGSVISNASPVYLKAKVPDVPRNITVISAGASDQMASWEQDKKHSLFTKYFLKGMAGEADRPPFGDGDGAVTLSELNAYLKDTLTYYARRYYGRDQTAKIVRGSN